MDNTENDEAGWERDWNKGLERGASESIWHDLSLLALKISFTP
jgi:hypothetical protein